MVKRVIIYSVFERAHSFAVFLILFLIINTADIIAQESLTKAPLDHPVETFRGEEGSFFINKNQSYHFLLGNVQTNEQEILHSREVPNALNLPEGETLIQINAADDNTYYFPLIVDGTPPKSTIELVNAPLYEDGDKLFAGKNLTINFEATDNASGVQEQYWAINQNGFLPYQFGTSEFSTNSNYSIYYYSVDQVGNVEPLQRRSFEVDVQGPALTFDWKGPQNLSVVSSESSINLSATDNASGVQSIYYWFNDEATEKYSTLISLMNLPDGEHTFYSYAVDNVKNPGDTLSYSFYLDKNAPEIEENINGDLSIQDAIIYISANSSIELTAKDNKSGASGLMYQINQEKEQRYNKPFLLSGNSGTYTIMFSSTDILGNSSEVQSFKVYLDNEAPSTNIKFSGYYSKTATGYAINPDTKIAFEANDLESGLKNIRFKIGSGEWQNYDAPIELNSIGNISITYYSIDEVNNTENEKTLNLTVTEATEIVTNATPDRPVLDNSAFYKIDARIQGPEKEIYLWVSTSPSDAANKYMLSFSADSNLLFPVLPDANKETILNISVEGSTSSYPITIDGSSPVTELHPAGAKSTQQGDRLIFAPGVSLTLSASDNITGVKEIFASENGGRYQLYDKPLSGYYAEQKNVIRYYAVDNVGNAEEEHSFIFEVDATPPITSHTFTSNFRGSNLSQFTTLTLDADDNLSGIDTTYIQLNENPPVVYSGEITLSELGSFEDTFNTLYYFSVDKVGSREQKKLINFRIDQSGPIASASWIGNYHEKGELIYLHPTTQLSFSATDSEMEVDEIWYTLNSGSRTKFEKPVEFKEIKNAVIQYAALDVLSNQGNIETFTVAVDENAPITHYSVTGNTLQNGEELILGEGAEVIFTAQDDASGLAKISYSINNGNPVNYTNPITFSSSGKKVLKYMAQDMVGNEEQLGILNLVYDRTAPEISLSYSKTPLTQNKNSVYIDSETLISVKSIDRESEVKSLEYALNDAEFSPYFRPFTISEGGSHQLRIKATDILGNEKEHQLTLQVGGKL